MDFAPVHGIRGVDVVRGIQGADDPLRFIVVRRKKCDFNDDTALGGLCQKIAITRKVFRAPALQIELRSAAGIARGFAARPGSHVAAGQGSKIIAQNAERLAGDFDVDAAEQACIVQSVGFESGEVAVIVEIGVEDGAVMFAAGNQGDSLSAKQKVVRILRMQPDSVGTEGLQQKGKQQNQAS